MTLRTRSWLACLVGLILVRPAPASRAEAKAVRVEVVNSSNHRSIKDARVFVLSTEGQEITAATTNDRGIAELSFVEETRHPKYVVVDHPAFFLSGVRWQAGTEEYYILATVLTLR